jgi:hypothetical protein
MAAMSGRLVGNMAVGDSGGGNYGYVNGTYGTLTPATFVDGGGTTRTVAIWNWDNASSGSVGFRLSGTSVSNSDTTFISVNVGGRILTRASATYTANDGTGHTLWSWSTNTSAYPTTGTVGATVL